MEYWKCSLTTIGTRLGVRITKTIEEDIIDPLVWRVKNLRTEIAVKQAPHGTVRSGVDVAPVTWELHGVKFLYTAKSRKIIGYSVSIINVYFSLSYELWVPP